MRALAALALLFLAAPAIAGETVAVLPLDAPEDAEARSVAEATRDLVAAGLSARGVVLVERERIDDLLEEGAVRIEKVRLVGASRAVTGSVGLVGGEWSVTVIVLSVPEGAVLGAETVGGHGDLGAAAERAAAATAEFLGSAAAPGRLRPDDRAAASLHYLRGIGFLRGGRNLEAVGELLEARRLAVRFPETRFFCARAWLAAGEPHHAAVEARAFLADAEDHELAPEARAILEEAAAARTPAAPPREQDPLRALAEVLLGSPDPGERRGALVDLLALGEEADGILAEAAARDPDHGIRFEILKALAGRGEEAFYAAAVANPSFLRYEVLERFQLVFTKARAVHLAEGLDAGHALGRRRAADRLRALWGLVPEEAAEEVRGLVLRAARSEEEERSLVAARILIGVGVREVTGILRERLPDPAFSDAYKTELLREAGRVRYPVSLTEGLAETLFPLLTSARGDLRLQVLTELRYATDAEVRKRVGEAVARIVATRRFPEEAAGLASFVAWKEIEGAEALGRELLRSKEPGERVAGIVILGRVDALSGEWALQLTEDGAEAVRTQAFVFLARHPEAVSFAELLSRWDRVLTGPAYRLRGDVSCYGQALRETGVAEMSLPRTYGAVPVPRLEDGVEAYRRWYEHWAPRGESYRNLAEGFSKASPEEKGRILEAIGEAGHPGFLALFPNLSGPESRGAMTGYRRGLMAFARRLGVPEEEIRIDGDREWSHHPLQQRILQAIREATVWR